MNQLEQDRMINDIKSFGSEIFDGQGLDFMKFQFRMMFEDEEDRNDKSSCFESSSNHSKKGWQSQNLSLWVDQLNKMEQDEFDKKQICFKPKHPKQANKNIPKHTKQQTKGNGPKQVKSPKTPKNKADQFQQQAIEKPQKMSIADIQNRNFMKPIKNLKPEMKVQIQRIKRQKYEQQNPQPVVQLKSLSELYTQKVPLYQKFLEEQPKKIQSVFNSRIMEQQRQQESFIGKPEINRNVEVKGSFEQRQKMNARKAMDNRSKIMTDVLKNSSFEPKLNESRKYKKVESVIKKSISQQNIALQSRVKSIKSMYEASCNQYEYMNEFICEDDNLFQRSSPKSSKIKANFDFKLKNTGELSHILEMEEG